MPQEFQSKEKLSQYLQFLLGEHRDKDEYFDDFVHMDIALSLVANHAKKFELNDDFVFNHFVDFCIDSEHAMAKSLGLILFAKQFELGQEQTQKWQAFTKNFNFNDMNLAEAWESHFELSLPRKMQYLNSAVYEQAPSLHFLFLELRARTHPEEEKTAHFIMDKLISAHGLKEVNTLNNLSTVILQKMAYPLPLTQQDKNALNALVENYPAPQKLMNKVAEVIKSDLSQTTPAIGLQSGHWNDVAKYLDRKFNDFNSYRETLTSKVEFN